MLNCVTLVGKVQEDACMKETANGIKYANLLLKCRRGFRNTNGEYEYDLINCTLWRGVAENSIDFIKKGNYVAIKARLQSRLYTNDEGTKFYNYDVIVEKLTFLTNEDVQEQIVDA